MEKVYGTPSDVGAEDGEVTVNGPDGVAVSLTPEAADETADRLSNAAMHAAGQRRMKSDRKAGDAAKRAARRQG